MAENDINILIVDDTPSNLTALAAALDGMNLTIFVAHSGEEALRLLLTRDFAAVLLDVNMPVMDGFETANLIRQRPIYEHLPIIFITAERFADTERLRAYQLGAVDYIFSPVLPEILRAKVAVFADLFLLRAQALQYAQQLLDKNAVIEQQYQQLADSYQQLAQFNQTLEQRVDEALVRSREKDHLMIHQSRLAVMGEMIGNIAHQWRQPLNALGLVLGNIQDAEQNQELTPVYLSLQIHEGQRLVDKMSTTISDFLNFFRPDKTQRRFQLNKAISDAIALVSASFKAHNIEICTEIETELSAWGSANEYSQVLLNLFSNAREAILARQDSPAGRIIVRLAQSGAQACVTVTDNGGGISEQAFSRMFEPYFSTKASGAGLGLYMSKMIIESSFGGRLCVRNVKDGAEFTLWTPILSKEQL